MYGSFRANGTTTRLTVFGNPICQKSIFISKFKCTHPPPPARALFGPIDSPDGIVHDGLRLVEPRGRSQWKNEKNDQTCCPMSSICHITRVCPWGGYAQQVDLHSDIVGIYICIYLERPATFIKLMKAFSSWPFRFAAPIKSQRCAIKEKDVFQLLTIILLTTNHA